MKDEYTDEQKERMQQQDDFLNSVQDSKNAALKNKIQKKIVMADFKRSNSYDDTQPQQNLGLHSRIEKRGTITTKLSAKDKALNNQMQNIYDKEKQYQKKNNQYKEPAPESGTAKEKTLKVFKKTINSLPPKGRQSVRRVLGD